MWQRTIITVVSSIMFTAMAAQAQNLRFLVGTYTENTAAEGVYMFSYNPQTADCQLLSVAASGNPSFVIPSPNGKMAYSVNEYNDGRQGVSSYVIDGDSISLAQSIPMLKSEVDGEDPCNLLYTGDAIISSNYSGGTASSFSLNSNGFISGLSGFAGYKMEYKNTMFNFSLGEESAKMHCAVLSPDGMFIFVTNLGNDCIHRFYRKRDGAPLGNMDIAWQNKGLSKFGPRHMVFSEDGRFAYLLCEKGDKLVVFSYAAGQLEVIQKLTAYKGKGHGSADIHLSPDGRFLYTSHRLKKDGIAIFSVNQQTGKVKAAGYQDTGVHPRNFAISPDGRFLLCACRDSNRIEIYSIDQETGQLTLTDKSIDIPAPVCINFLPQN